MSAERWGHVRETRSRLTLCGHSFKKSDGQPKPGSRLKCPVCGRDQHVAQNLFAARDFVPGTDLTWGDAERTFARRFKPPREGVVRTLQNLVAEMSRSGAHEIHLRGISVSHATLDQVRGELVVVRASPSGCSVRSGDVSFPADGPLLLDGHGAHFTEVCFSGGAVVCAGAQYSGTFQRCTFRCAVYVVHGAAAAFTDCSFSSHIGLVASGCATSATLSHCLFQDCLTSVIAESGALVRASGTALKRTETAVLANDPGTSVSLSECVLHGHGRGGVGERGAAACSGAVSLRYCVVSHFTLAFVAADPTARMEVHCVHVSTAGCGASVQGRALLAMRSSEMDLRLLDRRTDHLEDGAIALSLGLNADHPGGGRVQLERCHMHGDKCVGILMHDRSNVTALLCALDVRKDAVFMQSAGNRAVLRRCTARSTQHGCQANFEGGLLRLEVCELEASLSVVVVRGGARLVAVDSTVQAQGGGQDCHAVGVAPDSSAKLLRCEMTSPAIVLDCRGTAAAKQCGATIVGADGGVHARFNSTMAYRCLEGSLCVEGGSMRGAGPAVFLMNAVEARITDVDVLECTQAVHADEGATVAIRGCNVRGPLRGCSTAGRHAGHENVIALLLAGERALVEGCQISGSYVGIHASAGKVQVRDCEFSQVPEGGACVAVDSDTVVEGCSFSQCHRGLSVERGIVAVRGAAFGPSVRQCIDVSGAARVTVVDSQFIECGTAMRTGKGAELAVQDCRCEKSEVGIRADDGGFTVSAKRLTVSGGKMGVYATAGPDAPGSIKIVDSSVSHAEVGVSFIGRGVKGSVLRCEVEACEVGVSVVSAAAARLRRLRVSGGTEGMRAGDPDQMLAADCAVCGRRGQVAHAAAWAALRRDGRVGDSERRPRCVHEGGRALVTMEDCDVRGCRQRGVVVNSHGHVTAQRVHAVECGEVQFMEVMLGERSVFSDCSAAARGRAQLAVGFWQGSADIVNVAKPEPIPGIRVVEVT